MPEKFNIRLANANDAEELLKIYTPYVTDTAITFEYDVPSLEEFTQRIINISKKYPYIVAERSGEIVGYAYAGAFKERAAYDWAVETTIYVKQGCTASGIGRKLYAVLEKLLGKQGILNLNACIALLTQKPKMNISQTEVWLFTISLDTNLSEHFTSAVTNSATGMI